VCFPGQLVPAYSFALKLSGRPESSGRRWASHYAGLVANWQARRSAGAGPFEVPWFSRRSIPCCRCAVLSGRGQGGAPANLAPIPNLVLPDSSGGTGYLPRSPDRRSRSLPAPDFDGLPLDRYLSPQLLLPYDPNAWLLLGPAAPSATTGSPTTGTGSLTANVRSKLWSSLGRAVGSPHTPLLLFVTGLSGAEDTGAAGRWRWQNVDSMRLGHRPTARAHLVPELMCAIAAGRAVACSLGVESASPRVLASHRQGRGARRWWKGRAQSGRGGRCRRADVLHRLSPETFDEANGRRLVSWKSHAPHIAAFIVGQFELTARLARSPGAGALRLREIWSVQGDALGRRCSSRNEDSSKRGPRARFGWSKR